MKHVKTVVLVLVGAAALVWGADKLLNINDQEDCARLRSQVDRGYIKKVPTWCEGL